jgi:uncharacterized protein YgbK (DUF1537 family)
MNRVLVIADDLSGAAEIAGIAHRYGLPARIFREDSQTAAAGLTVVDTDSRSSAAREAAKAVQSMVRDLRRADFDVIFKKTDSVLRGPIAAEVEALRIHFGFSSAMLLAQNPSRGRAIEHGQYRIDGVPLHQTTFANDPEHPAPSSNARQILGDSTIAICDASNAEHVARWAGQTRGDVLPAGGADFFEAILRDRGLAATRTFEQALPPGPRLFVCGSASANSRELIALARTRAVPILAIEEPLDRTPGAAQRLLANLTDSAASALRKGNVTTVLLEGGATASAVCRRMGWNLLDVCGELAVGVVHLRAGEQDLIIKPGSYLWPDVVWKET